MLPSLTVLLTLQFAGELIVRIFDLPIPGPVIGMLILFVGLVIRGSTPAPMRETADALLRHLALLFIPAGAGVMLHFERLRAEWFPISVAILVSTLVTIGVTALTFDALRKRVAPAERSEP